MSRNIKKLILGGAIGSCVHVGGLHHFLKLAESEGYETRSLGPAVPVERLIDEIIKSKPDIAAISYRLTPGVAAALFEQIKQLKIKNNLLGVSFVFGGTPPAAEEARKSGIFDIAFSGEEPVSAVKNFLRGQKGLNDESIFSSSLVERIEDKYPYPLLRHHFGRPTLEETVKGVSLIAESEALDIISLGTDQNAQEFFFRQNEMDPKMNGAGGVPVRKPEDLQRIFKASRKGNFPLMRCYSGTRDLQKWAEMSVKTINNAWAAVPLCWYSVIDGRSQRSLFDAINENRSVMSWYASKDIPVEVNESHQWSLRDAHDSLAVVMAFLAAYNAKKSGVKNYVAQYMFNTPPGTSPAMDIAKMSAKLEMIESLEDNNFKAYREVRAGIAHFLPNPSSAKGQLASSAVISLALKPHILHVVGFSEGDHATYPEELIESCNIIHGVLHNCLGGLPDMINEQTVKKRRIELKNEAGILLNAIKIYGSDVSDDPWSDAFVISSAIKAGLLDAPHFRGNKYLCGNIFTSEINGAWHAVNEKTGEIIFEEQRISGILKKNGKLKK